MLTKSSKSKLRGTIFRHLDGLVTATSCYTLHKKGLLTYLLRHENLELNVLGKQFKANAGYLNVALRVLCSQGWLDQKLDKTSNKIYFSTNQKSKTAFELIHLYEDAVNLLKHTDSLAVDKMISSDTYIALEDIFNKFKSNFGLNVSDEDGVEYQILKHIEGVIVGPIIVFLSINGFLNKCFVQASFTTEECHKSPEGLKKILDFLSHLGWFKKKKDVYQFTDTGFFFAQRASAYGVIVSYIPTFLDLEELIFGNPLILKIHSPNEIEKHVHRELNVWGSGGAHSTYFKFINKIIIDLFNKPIEEQPKGVLDLGCGNGAFIEHIFNVIKKDTLRGKLIDDYPLLLVGADFNKAALDITRVNLIKADVWAKVIWGDIGRPDLLANDLKDEYNIELSDLLNVRTFLDHNRTWEVPKQHYDFTNNSSGAYAYQGEHLKNGDVEASLMEHLSKWKPYVEKFGLLIIELHTINTNLISKNIGKTTSTAYDATHGYSDQYILELDVFKEACKKAGLFSDKNYFVKFPNNELATISINLLK